MSSERLNSQLKIVFAFFHMSYQREGVKDLF